jgi:cytochrome c-550 PedF
MNMKKILHALTACAVMTTTLAPSLVLAHGDVTPQAVDIGKLKPLGDTLLKVNPYRGDKEAIAVGLSAYTQNCARCHGIDVISGGISPDLRNLDIDQENDTYFLESVLRGKVRNGAVYMPPFQGIMPQEAIWAIRSYVDTRRDSLAAAAPLNEKEQLAKKSGCLSCHATDAKGVGPAFRAITKKYAKTKNAETKLIAKVTKGGGGVWGTVPMPPMAESASANDIQTLVKWILDGAK